MALDVYLTVRTLKGDSVAKGHQDDADVLEFAWGASQSGTTHTGGGGGAGKASVQDLSITKYLDSMSVGLETALFKGSHLASVVLRSYTPSGGSPVPYLTYELSGVIVTSYVIAGSGGEDRLAETVTFNFAKIKISTYKQNPNGTVNAPVSVTFDVAQNVVS